MITVMFNQSSYGQCVESILRMTRQVSLVEVETMPLLNFYVQVGCVFALYSLLLLFCVSVSSSELEPEPMEELSWLSWGKVRKLSPDSDRDGVSVRDRIFSRLLGLISFLIFRVIQLPRLKGRSSRELDRGPTKQEDKRQNNIN